MSKDVIFHNPHTYLLAVKEQRKMNRITKSFFFSLILIALIGMGFTFFQPDTESNSDQTKLENTIAAEEAIANAGKVGIVFLAFDPDELDGIEDWALYFNEGQEDEELNINLDEWAMDVDLNDHLQVNAEGDIQSDKNLTVSNF